MCAGGSGKGILTSKLSWACALGDVDWTILGFAWRRGCVLFWACFLALLVWSQLWRGCCHGSLLGLLSPGQETSLPELRWAATSQDESEQLHTEPCLVLTLTGLSHPGQQHGGRFVLPYPHVLHCSVVGSLKAPDVSMPCRCLSYQHGCLSPSGLTLLLCRT